MKAKLDARPDTLDFRDKMFVPTLIDTPISCPLESYQKMKVPILDQGKEGACTGFGLATVIHYLLRTRKVVPNKEKVSPWMLYALAKRYDEWPGEEYEGSSARGAMKGWYKHGVCRLSLWGPQEKSPLTYERTQDAKDRPLGAYFRVNHKDLVAMHTAIAEVGILYATALVHAGWSSVGDDGIIEPHEKIEGGHAFAIVGYEKEGFWIQNSWGKKWGKEGFALLSYNDWLINGADVWVARLGVPIEEAKPKKTQLAFPVGEPLYVDLRPHIITLGNDGKLSDSGTYGTSKEEVEGIFQSDIPRITKKWRKKRFLLWAHGGLISERAALLRIAEYRKILIEKEIYLLAFSWRTEYWTTLKNILQDAVRRRRPEGFLDATKDFMWDRLDDALEPLARMFTGYAEWQEMKENALLASHPKNGGVSFTLNQLAKFIKKEPSTEIHLIGHSAGSILLAPVVESLATVREIKTCTLWAPACTIQLFKKCYLSWIGSHIKRFTLFTLTEEAEKEDQCFHIYHKSLLHLVSAAFEKRFRIPFIREGTPLLGMEKFIKEEAQVKNLFKKSCADWIRAPNTAQVGSPEGSRARRHGDFDDDTATVQATLARVLGKTSLTKGFDLNPLLPEIVHDRRMQLN